MRLLSLLNVVHNSVSHEHITNTHCWSPGMWLCVRRFERTNCSLKTATHIQFILLGFTCNETRQVVNWGHFELFTSVQETGSNQISGVTDCRWDSLLMKTLWPRSLTRRHYISVRKLSCFQINKIELWGSRSSMCRKVNITPWSWVLF